MTVVVCPGYLGDFPAGAKVQFKWSTYEYATGKSLDPTSAGYLAIYKGSSTTERSSASGITRTGTFDSLAGIEHIEIDLSDDTDAGFYAAGEEYSVVRYTVNGISSSGSVNVQVAQFSIERNPLSMGAVWDELLSAHLISGSFGKFVNAVKSMFGIGV